MNPSDHSMQAISWSCMKCKSLHNFATTKKMILNEISMRLKVLVMISVVTIILMTWAWTNNTFQLNMAGFKNRLIHERTMEITTINNIDSLKQKTLQLIDQLEKQKVERRDCCRHSKPAVHNNNNDHNLGDAFYR
jgi:hypothetical protein